DSSRAAPTPRPGYKAPTQLWGGLGAGRVASYGVCRCLTLEYRIRHELTAARHGYPKEWRRPLRNVTLRLPVGYSWLCGTSCGTLRSHSSSWPWRPAQERPRETSHRPPLVASLIPGSGGRSTSRWDS